MRFKGSIVALGNFDGFHLGHQAVVGRAVARAFHERRPAIVATFDPHPVRLLQARPAAVPPDHARPARAPVRPRRRRRHAGVRIRRQAALDQRRGVRRVAARRQDRRGRRRHRRRLHLRQGPRRQCRHAADARRPLGIVAEAVAPVLVDGERVSSGRIREALVAGDIGRATHLLTPPLRDRRRGPARRPARPRARLPDRQPRRSATTSARATASTPCA